MRIVLIILLSGVFFAGCIYDPPTGVISVKNSTDEAVYIAFSCADTLSYQNGLKVKVHIGANAYDTNGNKIPDTMYYPQYRVPVDSTRWFAVGGTPSHPNIGCDDCIKVFVIADSVMLKYPWADICKNKRYVKKITYTQNQLDSLGWKLGIGNN